MPTAPWTTDRAALWRAAATSDFDPTSWWYVGAGLVLLTTFVSPVFWDILPCDHPVSDCGPLPVFMTVLPLLIVTAVLLLLLPWLAALTSAVAAGVAIAFWFPHLPLVAVWPAFPVALALWLWHGRSRMLSQRRIASAALVPLPPQLATVVRAPQHQKQPWDRAAVAAVAVAACGLVVGAGLYAVYAQQVGADEESTARGIVVSGRVLPVPGTAEDEELYEITVQLPDSAAGPAHRVVLEPYPPVYTGGEQVDVLIDPVEPERTRLLENVPDRTYIMGFGHLGVLLGLSALAWLVTERARAARLRRSLPRNDVGIPIRVRLKGRQIQLQTVDTEWTFASLCPDREDTIPRRSQDTTLDAFLFGGLSMEDPARVVLPSGESFESSRLMAGSRDWRAQAKAAVRAAVVVPEPAPGDDGSPLLWRRWNPWLGRGVAAAALTLPFAVFPWLTAGWARALVALAAVALALLAIAVEAPQVLLDSRRLSRRTMWTVTRIPVWAIARVELTFDLRVRLNDNRGEVIEIDLGEANRELANRIAGFISRRIQPLDASTPGTSFAETTQQWWRQTPFLLVAVIGAVVTAWALF